MRLKLLSLIVALSLLIVSLPVLSANAKPKAGVYQATLEAAGPLCADSTLLKAVGADLTAVGAQLKKIPSTGAGGVYSIMITIANMREKYEDMPPSGDSGCEYLVVQTIIVFANVGDYGLVEMGGKLGLDRNMIQKNREFIVSRIQDKIKQLLSLVDQGGTQ